VSNDDLERRVGSMNFGQVVRLLEGMRETNFGNLAACHKDIMSAGQRRHRTIQVLLTRLSVTYAEAVPYTMVQAVAVPTLRDAGGLLNTLEAPYHEVTELMTAIGRRWLERAEVVIGLGVDVNVSTKRGTALVVAAIGGHESIVEKLLEARANVNRRDGGGMTALMAAAGHGRQTVVAQLLQARADVNARCGSLGPLELARQRGYQAIVDLLRQAGAEPAPESPAEPVVPRLQPAPQPVAPLSQADPKRDYLFYVGLILGAGIALRWRR
jgi:hypothetical protein